MYKPFLRWAGGKSNQLDQILPFLPQGKRLVEPFVGAGSIFLNADFDTFLINDFNKHLIVLYRELSKPDFDMQRLKELHQYVDSDERFRELKLKFNHGNFTQESLAMFFLVLNRTCFNGLTRFNKKGEFNVPWCQRPTPYFPEQEILDFRSKVMALHTMCGSFEKVFPLLRTGDVVFCDPPYQPMPDKHGFTNYTGVTFGMEHQRKLVECAKVAQKRGVPVVITNSSAPKIVQLYTEAGFKLHPLKAPRTISANAGSRGDVEDVIAILHP